MNDSAVQGDLGGGGRALLIAASLIIVIAGLQAAKSLILPFLLAMFLAMVTLPLLNWMQDKKVPTGVAVLLTLILALSIVVGLGVMIGGSVAQIGDEIPKYRERLEEISGGAIAQLEKIGLPVSQEAFQDLVNPDRVWEYAQAGLRGIATALSNMFLVLLTIVFVLFEAAGIPAKLQKAFGDRRNSERYEKIKSEIQQYLRAKTVISLATGTCIGIGLWIVGVDFAFLWASLAFVLNYIPNLGSIIAAVPPVLLTLVQLGPVQALVVAILFVAVNVVFGNVIEPYLVGRKVGLSTLVVFLSLVFWGWVWGPVGMLLSVPLTMIVKIMLENTEDLRWIAILLGPAPAKEKNPKKASA
ncbi:MAG: AI-2E family transporter [Acidobacteria bacterium]|nr:AI-2E family transporter [Acidobacteriota bacterium]NIM62170.1 AI-2E family transporter [Acidobacteriota bacterium]NIO58964.1 AI-2E family transporter [Acidobacteriota bacterium]NIQ30010.1 AI-2E family transporter [Acidobacteriota bacterium]NIQ84776.1 AI-2E family transporter [Acidobacteriota bacterium]